MNNEVTNYLDTFDPPLPDSVRKRIEELEPVFCLLREGRPPEQLFLSDSFRPGTEDPKYESLWAFEGGCWMEARDFMSRVDVDVSPYRGLIKYIGLAYDPKTDSEMRVEVQTEDTQYSLLSATGNNREYLKNTIVKDLLVPALKKPKPPALPDP